MLKETPVTRVVTLLRELSKKSEAEGKQEEDLYERFVCWAKSVIDSKTASNSAAAARAEELETYIADIEAGRIEFTSERTDLEKELKGLNSDIEAADALREKEKTEFEDAQEEIVAAAMALDKAIRVLSEATKGPSSSLAQRGGAVATLGAGAMRALGREGGQGPSAVLAQRGGAAAALAAGATFQQRQREAADLHRAVELGARALSAGDAVFLRRLLTGDVPQRADAKKLNRKATFKMSYEARSTKIHDVLKDMNATFTDNLREARENEAEAAKSHEVLMTTKTEQRDETQQALENMIKESGARALNKEEAKDELDSLTEQIKNDEKYIKQTEEDLAEKKKEWKERKALRTEELAAFSKAIEVLYNDDARDVAAKSYKSQQLSLLQASASSSAASASATAQRHLRAAASQARDARLLGLAGAVAAANGGHFEEVIASIETMMKELDGEEAVDLKNKERCEADRVKDTRRAVKTSRTIDEVTDLVQRLVGEASEIETEIQNSEDTIQKSQEALGEASKLREQEQAEWETSDSQDKEMKSILANANKVLTEFYSDNKLMLLQRRARSPTQLALTQAHAPESAGEAGRAPPPPPSTWQDPYGGQTEESTSIITILEMAEADVDKDIAHAKANEEEAAREFKELEAETNAQVEELTEAITNLNSARGEKEGQIEDAKTSRGASQKELASAMKTIKAAEPGCDYLSINFATRVKARQIERDGLVKAKAILNGGKFDDDDAQSPPASLIQRRRLLLRR